MNICPQPAEFFLANTIGTQHPLDLLVTFLDIIQPGINAPDVLPGMLEAVHLRLMDHHRPVAV
jgi:hypothetical protein